MLRGVEALSQQDWICFCAEYQENAQILEKSGVTASDLQLFDSNIIFCFSETGRYCYYNIPHMYYGVAGFCLNYSNIRNVVCCRF